MLLELKERLTSLDAVCLTGLGAGLEAMVRGDLTVAVEPVTQPIASTSDNADVQELGGALQRHARRRPAAACESYNARRLGLADMIGEIGDTAARVAGSTQEMASTTEQTGEAITESRAPRAT